jgi:hypothetical protein
MCQARHKEEVAAEWLQCQNIGGHDLESLTRRSQPLIRLLAAFPGERVSTSLDCHRRQVEPILRWVDEAMHLRRQQHCRSSIS